MQSFHGLRACAFVGEYQPDGRAAAGILFFVASMVI